MLLAILVGTGVALLAAYLTLILLLRLLSPRPKTPTPVSLRYLTASNAPSSGTSSRPLGEWQQLPKLPSTLSTPATLELSVVVPAYDEESRLKQGMSEALAFLEDRRRRASRSAAEDGSGKGRWKTGSYEVLIVDDGSKDRTVEVALELAKEHRKTVLSRESGEAQTNRRSEEKEDDNQPGEIRIVRLGKNRGKGGAVRHGMLHARGAKILFADADGASHFPDLEKLLAAYDRIAALSPRRKPAHSPSELPSLRSQIPGSGSLSNLVGIENGSASPKSTGARGQDENDEEEEEQALVLGSRAHLVTSPSVVSRSPLRNLLMRAFHLYLYLLGVRAVKDTQCGFKLLARGTVRDVVSALHVEGWIFDVELLLLSSLLKPPVPVEEVPITWNEVGGSKLSVVRDSIVMAVELLIIRLNYGLGVWSVPQRRR